MDEFALQLGLKQLVDRVDSINTYEDLVANCGRVCNVVGLVVQVTGLNIAIGQNCKIIINEDNHILAEVIGFGEDKILIMPYDHTVGIASGMFVMPVPTSGMAPVNPQMLGRVLDAFGHPLDDGKKINYDCYYSRYPKPINPLKRQRITKPMDLGVRAINTLNTICYGQRMGIFAASGIGKSILLGMMTKFSEADVVVVGLIGERGREVKEFIEDILGEQGLQKSVIVAIPADSSPLMKVAGATYATSIAEYFRDQNKHVLLIIDSLTRFAQASREISLSAGELPATKGYTPSVFAKLSKLVERSGNGINEHSSITAIYTVLIEDNELNDPVAEHIRSMLDGHIMLSRNLAEAGHYPAIDIDKSISRVMSTTVAPELLAAALFLKQIVNAYMKNIDMINIGMYQPGSDKRVDLAIKLWPAIREFLTQSMNEQSTFEEGISKLDELIAKFKEAQ